ncbi:ATP-dependent RNA helicase DbpA [Halomonas garicola]|uniref:ATP-dependent RNA helicase DbpA n=1 Tax=Halomonas garicola TaxID=1690008 RepID=UPI00289CEFD7|nr:ATP-dependent RNA helicase DbpA [Halomonas garicola]
MSITSFSRLALPGALLTNLDSLGYRAMTPVQAQALPAALEGRDVLAQAQTGSGKTAAFGLSLLARLDLAASRVQSLVLCPTRELADQVAGALRTLARKLPNVKVLTLCGGAPFGPQLASLEHGAHIVVGTPGRVEDHLRKGTLRLNGLTTLVLDEADRMLDMGFQAAIDDIVAQTPARRQTLLFSATYPADTTEGGLSGFTRGLLREPHIVRVEDTHDDATIEQHFYRVDKGRTMDDEAARLAALRQLLLHYRPESGVVFCNTKRETRQVADDLNAAGMSALALNGDLEQKDRERILVMFANQSVTLLVATDVAARGLDIDGVDAVFNVGIAHELDVHTHRIGRTGRAGERGVACTLVSDQERYRLLQLSEQQGAEYEPEPLPEVADPRPLAAPMATLQLGAGKKDKLRPGDILGALTGEGGIAGSQVGKIKVLARSAYVAVERSVARQALAKLERDKLKGRNVRARRVNG